MAEKNRGKNNAPDASGETGYQQSRREKLAENAAHDAGYTLSGNGYNIHQKSDRRSAYKELESLQKSAIADYSEWAKEAIKYDDLDSANAAKNLKQYNDTYTMSMLMGVIAPLENGCDLSSIMQCLMSYNVIKMMNPDLDMDSSRMFYNFKNTVAPMISDMKADHPVLGRLFSPITSEIDETLSEAAGAKFATTIDAHEKVHDIDTMYLTPRQVAALKLNFMEQYYGDLRKTDDDYARRECTSDYNKAMKHLNAICANGGYDMSVVATEERYLVGLKIQENPDYATMFAETTDVFGVKLDMSAVQSSHRFGGQFISTDEHPYYGGSDLATNGTFHVRMPMSQEDMQKDMESHAASFHTMRQYVNSPMFTGDAAAEKELLEKIDEHEKQYVERMGFVARTDNLKVSADKLYAKAMESAVEAAGKQQNVYGVDAAYIDEMQNVTLHKVAQTMGYDPNAMRNNPRRAFDTESPEYQKMMSGLTRYVEDGKRDGSLSDSVTPETALENIQLNYFEGLSAGKQYDVLAHVITNVEQGYKEHQSDRNNIRKDGVSRLRDVYADMGLVMEDTEDSSYEDTGLSL